MVATPIDDTDVCDVIGMVDPLVALELVRTEASRDELAAAIAFVSGPAAMSTGAYRALGLRMQRLVDLLSVTLPAAPDVDARFVRHG